MRSQIRQASCTLNNFLYLTFTRTGVLNRKALTVSSPEQENEKVLASTPSDHNDFRVTTRWSLGVETWPLALPYSFHKNGVKRQPCPASFYR